MASEWLSSIERAYSVNPIIFGVLYFGTFIPCWYFVFKIIGAIRKKDLDKVIIFSIVELFLLAFPYLYIMIWGQNLPFWVYIVLILLIILSIIPAIRSVKKRFISADHDNKSQMLWDFCSYAYRHAIGYSIPHQKMFNDVVTSLNLRNSSRILDAGCGAGDFEKYICSKNLNFSVEAVDFSAQMIKGARKKCKRKNIKFNQADLNNWLPYRDNYFDSIICLQVLFALPRTNFTLREFYRVMKPQGELIIADPKPDANMGRTIIAHFKEIRNLKGAQKLLGYLNLLVRFPLGLIVLLFNLQMDKWAKQGHYHFYSAGELKQEIEKTGMKIMKISNTLAKQDNLIVAKKTS